MCKGLPCENGASSMKTAGLTGSWKEDNALCHERPGEALVKVQQRLVQTMIMDHGAPGGHGDRQ